jgi:isoleucyl-tRNA synthetase
VAKAVAAADPAQLTAAYRAGTATVDVEGSPVPLEDGDLIVTETPREGWTVASGSGLTVALDLALTPELERAGLVREVVRLIQEARKSSGLEVTDRIELWWTVDGDDDGRIATALTEHGEQVAGEVLASALHAGTAGEGAGFEGPEGLRFWVARA